MKKVASRDNALFKSLSKIEHSSRERRDAGKTILDGVHLIEACISSGLKPDLVVVREDSSRDPEIRAILENQDAVEMSAALFDKISPVKHPTGILALISIPAGESTGQPEFCIFLDEIQDPGNMGAILRSAAAAGAADVYLSEGCADPWSPKVLRAAMGGHFSIRIHQDADIASLLGSFEGTTVALTLEAEVSIYDLDLRGRTGFVIGNEGAGISDAVLSRARIRAKIPMPGSVESLNAAQAATLCLFERVRQKA